MNTISWRTPTTPLPMEINPRVVFDRLFGDGATTEERLERIETATQHSRRGHRTRSAIWKAASGATDRNRVAEYLDTIREIERRIQLAEKQNANSQPDRSHIARGHSRRIIEEHSKLMFDLMAIAFQADITRISTFMMAREVSYRTFPMLGISEASTRRRIIRTIRRDWRT